VSCILAALAGACARPAAPRLPDTEEFVFPSTAPGELTARERRRLDEAWGALLAGRTAAAEKEFRKLLARRPGLHAAETALGYALLRLGRLEEAAGRFQSVLARRAVDFPALMGAASVAARRGELDQALALYKRAQAVSPRNLTAGRRLGEVKLQLTEQRVAAGRAALLAGDRARAIAEYRRALSAAPELASLRVELADLLLEAGDAQGAVSALAEEPGQDRQALARLGDVLVQIKDYARALETYRRMLARDPGDAEAQARAAEVRRTLELLQMPQEYRRIATAARVTRADLAALVSVKVTALARAAPAQAQVVTDISGSWARDHILRVVSLDILDVYPNHTFQPGSTVRRGELARAVGRVLDLLNWPVQPAPALTDMSASNLFHAGATRAVAAGLMDVTPQGAFEPWRPVSGKDAVDVIEALARLVGP
jgi:tetratricopeptide (TPR) repeat protein